MKFSTAIFVVLAGCDSRDPGTDQVFEVRDCTPTLGAGAVDLPPCQQPLSTCSFYACVPGSPDPHAGLCQPGYSPKMTVCTLLDGGAGRCSGLGDCN